MASPDSTSDSEGTSSRLLAGWRALKNIPRARRTVSAKLILVILLTTAIALCVAGTILLLSDLRDNRAQRTQDLRTEADIVAMAIAPALSFNDPQAAARNLNALQARPALDAAAVYRSDGSGYASFVRDATMPPPSRLPAFTRSVSSHGETLEVFKPIVQNGEQLGTLYLRAHYDVSERLFGFLKILGVVMLLSLVAAIFAAGWLQSAITRPLSEMHSVAQRLIAGSDHGVRMAEGPDDEFGTVTRALNNMLGEIASRTQAIESANEALTREVSGRLVIERALRDSERLYRGIGESIDYGVWICDAQGRNTYVSDSFLRLLGITQEQCSDFRWAEYLHPDDRDETIRAWKECVATGTVWYREHRVKGVDGQYHPILAQGVPIRDDAGRVASWAGINLDIERMKRTEQALREADRRKDEFLATLAHELRNPLAPIRNAARLLGLPAANEEQRTWARDIIARQVRNMALLLDDLLDVSRITRGQLELKKDYVDLRSVVDVAIESAKPLIDAKKHELSVVLPEHAVRIEADPLRLSQILSNLLTNAAKYTDPCGRIQLRAVVEDRNLHFSVRDNGIGLRADSIATIFEMFSQVTSAVDRAEGGLGIGLALVKGLVRLHGGYVEALSAGPGHGSEFSVHLPRCVTDVPAVVPDAAPSSPMSSPSQQKRLLIADDNRDAATTLGALLELSGYSVTTVFCGQDALTAAAALKPDAFLLDIGMPDMSGYDLARRIRHEAWGRNAYLVALTGWGQAHDKEAARAAGFDEHLTKPIDPTILEAMLSRALSPGSLQWQAPRGPHVGLEHGSEVPEREA
jgi:PAS domain S-box-containing protein